MTPSATARDRSDSLDAFLEPRRATRVDDALERYLPRPPACPPLVSEAMRYSLFAGGKRLRPILTLAAADAVARRGDAAIATGAGAGARFGARSISPCRRRARSS